MIRFPRFWALTRTEERLRQATIAGRKSCFTHKEELAAAGYAIIGVSKDKQALQKKFADAQGLQFPLIADTETTLLQELGCWGEKVACGRKTIGILRTTYLVNEEGVIEKIFTPKEIKTKIHAEQILDYINK